MEVVRVDQFPFLFYQNATRLLVEYDGKIPFHLYLKDCFREHKNWGSKDRKRYRACCYYFWRNAVGVSRNHPNEILNYLQKHYTPTQQQQTSIHPYQDYSDLLSLELQVQTLTPWFLDEPWVWLRPLRNSADRVEQQLSELEILPVAKKISTLAVTAQANLNPILTSGIAYIQDIASQQAMKFEGELDEVMRKKGVKLWDCCAGAGGKSLTLLQQYPGVSLLCSDVRGSILTNLRDRFESLKQPIPKTAVYNIIEEIPSVQFEVVMADVPCSGSGTWRRNPENLHFFDRMGIRKYAEKQARILDQIVAAVNRGGYILYLTCSVFKAENEENIATFLAKHPEFRCLDETLLGGKQEGGDYIYRAILKRL